MGFTNNLDSVCGYSLSILQIIMILMDKYQKELQALKPWDEVQCTTWTDHNKGYPFIITAGHGYLVVRKDDMYADRVKPSQYSFEGKYAYYLEEDCEAGQFIDSI